VAPVLQYFRALRVTTASHHLPLNEKKKKKQKHQKKTKNRFVNE